MAPRRSRRWTNAWATAAAFHLVMSGRLTYGSDTVVRTAVEGALIALIENHQQADGSVMVPKALRPYTGFERIGPR